MPEIQHRSSKPSNHCAIRWNGLKIFQRDPKGKSHSIQTSDFFHKNIFTIIKKTTHPINHPCTQRGFIPSNVATASRPRGPGSTVNALTQPRT